MKTKIVLSIETSCDETSAAVLTQDSSGIKILSNIVASSALLQSSYGGIIPEQAAREQIKSIIPVINEALSEAFPSQSFSTTNPPPIDSIAVTQGPGLIGSLLVGVETAKTLAMIWKKPLIPVNHLLGHFYANWISPNTPNHPDIPNFPCIGLLVSGGHTDLVLFTDHGKFQYLGGTRDDAAGECFDKCARLLNLPYPGGPEISKLAKEGNPKTFPLPRPMINSKDFDFSFSGLKTAVANLINQHTDIPIYLPAGRQGRSTDSLNDLCASIQQAIVDVLVKKTFDAAKKYGVKQIIIAGGVASNRTLSETIAYGNEIRLPRQARISIPPASLCTDNAAMIGAASFFEKPAKNLLGVQANPNLSLAY